MKAVILSGGLGTRISEETATRPKPMVEIGGRPLLWHLLKIYSSHGVNEFIICCGYKGYVIKEYFANYFLHMSDVSIDMTTNEMKVHQQKAEPWKITLLDTGDDTQTGGRLRRVREFLNEEENFCFTYGDGLSDVDITGSIHFHKSHGAAATMTAVQPPGRFGAIMTQGTVVERFLEKPSGDGGWINGGFFILKPSVLDYIDGDGISWESKPLESLAKSSQLHAWFHRGFWQPMDTLRDKQLLEALWSSGKAPWKIWK
jgi:glucose-1-phosphate cytidylyltransferase